MKKIFFIIFILCILFLSYAEQSNENHRDVEKIILPKIPIYLNNQDNYNYFSFNQFKLESIENSFYKINISKPEINYIKKTSGEDIFSCGIGGGLFGSLCGIIYDFGIWAFSGGEYDDNGDWQEEKFKFSGTAYGAAIFTTIGLIAGSIGDAKPITKTYNINIERNNEIINSETIIIPYSDSIDSNIIMNFILRSDILLRKWDYITNLLMKYNDDSEFRDISLNHNIQINKLLLPKGEFETTQQYEERIERENIIKAELQAEYEQENKITEEKDSIRKIEILKQIKEEIQNIEFKKSCDFEVSDYNADNQSFTFNISGTQKKVIVPLMRAPKFKENVSFYCVQKKIRPTLHGTWQTNNDDYVLINTKTNAIIPWEGSIPTIVEKSVENPPNLSASVKLFEPSGEGFLDAEETAIIKVTITNSGKGSAKRTRISLFQQNGSTLYYDVSNTIDEILSNQSIISEFKLTVPENIENGNVEFKISFLEEQGFEPAPLTFTAETRAMLKPELKLLDFGVEDSNGDGKISRGDTADITLRLQNIGQGKAKQVIVDIAEDRLKNVFIISEKHFELYDMESGESKDVIFTITTNNRVNEIIDINFNIQEERPQFSFNDKITLEIEKTQKQLEPIRFSGKDIEKAIEYYNNLSIDIEQNITKSNKTNENAIGIIFGIESYRNVSDVNFALRDATIMKEYFSKTIGIPEEQIYFRANDEVTLGEFRKVFSNNGWLDKRVEENKTDIYFYYAGHGAPAIKEEKAFLIPFDGDPNYPVQTGYSLENVFENLSKLNANSVTVILDACFTGANRENEMLLADARPVSIQLKNNYVNNVTVFSATSSNEISSSFPINKHGLFSYFLMKGMQGEADANNDNQLTIQELFDYTKSNVSKTAGTLDREQTPQLECLEPEKIIIIYQD